MLLGQSASTPRVFANILKRAMSTTPFPRAVKASFWRGGTSKGVFFNISDLPKWFQSALSTGKQPEAATFTRMEEFFAAVLGSPDPYGRQLNGMGGGISSLSKAMVVGPSSQPDADIDYTFFQIGVKDGKLDMAGNCGNLTSVVGPFAFNSGIYQKEPVQDDQGTSEGEAATLTLRMRNMNTAKIIESTFQATTYDGRWEYQELGKCSIDGVPGTGSTITLSFLQPQGAKTGKALPTGKPVDHIEIGDQTVRASLIDVSNPGVFVDGRDIGWKADATSDQLNANQELLEKLEAIRKRGTEMMGLDPNISSIPKIVLLFPARSDGLDISCQALSMEQAHKAVPVTLALNLGVACKMEGTLPHALSKHLHHSNTIIGHPSGILEVGAAMEDGKIVGAKLIRTARCHMEGYVNTLRSGYDGLDY
ncbi:uncharacterized protein Z520_04315 [Fonsecaea multimorphosa CBS 102226]|uniref:DUF453-domain-containing protein n=1 Tax=Fonsecaea multimorphosa CBS 102226 TaxID=1442371 RepID=A0A0D2HCQ1_9EURO|nr:uncharacterized protein Z520_04315 [Fonsecaea multimorphosa CBS 102226]KIX99680.1 hypothetical protein Z520_04315 [Fonsecaea multimorphosa CBS 102226]OAL26731.1 hypothetical protein AYO22_04084 [Fonsecaea multimorphosa]